MEQKEIKKMITVICKFLQTSKLDIGALSVNYSVAIWQALRIVISTAMLFLVPAFTTKATQGQWYLFVSIGALSAIAEMGISSLFVVFAAHERGNHTAKKNSIDKSNLSPPFSGFVLTWSCGIGALFFFILSFVGLLILSYRAGSQLWQLQWVIYSCGIVLTLIANLFLAWFEGIGYVLASYKMRAMVTMISTFVAAIMLWNHCGIWALSLSQVLGPIAALIVILPLILHSVRAYDFRMSDTLQFWLPQVLPLLKNNIFSVVGGYIVFQAATIMAYIYKGIENAGEIGFTTNVWMGGFSIFYAFLASSMASTGTMLAQGNVKEAVKKSLMAFKQSAIIFLLIGICAISMVKIFPEFSLFQRMTSTGHMWVLFVGLILHLGVVAIAVFFRSAKKEPFAKISIITAFICIIVVLFSNQFHYSPFYGFLVANLLALIYCTSYLNFNTVDFGIYKSKSHQIDQVESRI